MDDRSMPVLSVVALTLWAVGLGLAVVDLLNWAHTGHIGVVTACAGGTLHIRGFVVRLERTGRQAFELGREYERTRLHSIR